MGTSRTMGRRKIDIAYLPDDRVRKVTFCKRKGGLFKKADDLSKLCGVEVAVVIIGDKKTNEYASTDMNRIIERYQTMQSGAVPDDSSEIAKLWTQLETQRREMEKLTRELAAEKRKVEELRTAHLAGLPALQSSLTPTLPVAMTSSAPSMVRPIPTHSMAPVATQMLPNVLLSQPHLMQNMSQPQVAMHHVPPAVSKPSEQMPPTKHADGNDSDMSDDTAEVDSHSEGTTMAEEPALKRRRVEEADAIETQLPVHMPCNVVTSGIPVDVAGAPVVSAV